MTSQKRSAADNPPRLSVLLPCYNAEATLAEPLFEKLSAAQTAQYLMESLINARNLPHHGFHETVRLARRGIQGCRQVYSHFSQVENQLAQVLGLD